MNYTTTTTIGLDAIISSIQTDLYSYVGSRWSGEINGYGRVYKNKKSEGAEVPEWYLGNSEYEQVYFDDNYSGNFFFIAEDSHPTEDEMVYTTKLKCVFMVDLEQILPFETGRADAKAQRDIIEKLREIAYGRYTITGIETGIDTIFSSLDKSGLDKMDIQPLHSFSVNLNIHYYLENQC